jgi:hypothetical protein
MKRSTLTAIAALGLLAAFPLAPRTYASHSSSHKKYVAEHHARVRRHRTLTPAQRRARMKKYAAEHRARQHRHRAHLVNQRKKHS